MNLTDEQLTLTKDELARSICDATGKTIAESGVWEAVARLNNSLIDVCWTVVRSAQELAKEEATK